MLSYYDTDNSFDVGCSSIKLGSFFSNNHFGNGCKLITFIGLNSAIYNVIQYYNFAQGLSSVTVEGEGGRSFETRVEMDSNGNLKEFCLADLIYDENADSYYYSASFIGEI